MQRTIIAVSIAIAVIAAAVIAWRFVDNQTNTARNRAIQGCAEVAAGSGSEEFPFNGGVYTICMDDKGIPSSIK